MLGASLKRGRATASAVLNSATQCQLVQQAACTSSPRPAVLSRLFSVSHVARGMEEFFPPKLKEGEILKPAGRAWEAAELRLKGWGDLHKLWFVCLKERNMLLSERLYYRQVNQAAPEPERLWKVKKTMARIKVVIGERARAEEAMERDKALLEKAKLLASGQPMPSGPPRPKLSGKTVTYKQFGRKYTVPVELAPATPTRQQRKVAAKNAAYWARVKALRAQIDGAEAAVGILPAPLASSAGSGGASLLASLGAAAAAAQQPAA